MIYSSIDSDIILIARKGGEPGRFDPRVLEFAATRPALERLKLTDPDVVSRRAIAGSNVLGPFLRSYGSPANSDFFPFVDQRASKTRFTNAHVGELISLQASSVPMLEMLGTAGPRRATAHDVRRVSFGKRAEGA